MLSSPINLPSLTILIPCLNEEVGIGAVVSEYATAFPNAEILVVDNGSEDGTAEAARSSRRRGDDGAPSRESDRRS